jgi:hypothetical protein
VTTPSTDWVCLFKISAPQTAGLFDFAQAVTTNEMLTKPQHQDLLCIETDEMLEKQADFCTSIW